MLNPESFEEWMTFNSFGRKNSIDNNSGGFRIAVYIVILIAIRAFIFIQSSFPATVSRKESGMVIG